MLVRTQLLRSFIVVAVLGLLIWGLTDVRRRAEIDPARLNNHRTDVTVYTEAGAAFFDGRDPYAVTNLRGWHYLYPPLFALLMAPLHPLPTAWQGVIWFLLSLLMAGGCLLECRLIVRKLLDAGAPQAAAWRDLRPWVVVGAFIAILFPFLDTLQRGQVGVAVLWPLLLGFRLVLERPDGVRTFLGGVCLAMPVALKATPALPVCIVLVRLLPDALRHGRLLRQRFAPVLAGVTAGLLLFFLLVPAVAIGWTENLRHLRTWYERVASNQQVGPDQQFNVHSTRNQSLANAVYRLGNWMTDKAAGGPDERIADDLARAGETLPMDAPLVGILITGARAGLVALLLLVAVRWRAPAADPLGQAAAFGLACAMTLPLSPISWGHHFVILLPGLIVLPLAVSVQGHRLAARVLAVAPAVLLLLHYLSLELAAGIAGRLGILGIGLTVWCVAAALLLLRSPSSNIPSDSPLIPALSYR